MENENIISMDEEMSEELSEEVVSEGNAPEEDSDPEAVIDELRAENRLLVHKLICLKNNIPSEIAEDIICIAEKSGGEDFEEAAVSAFERIKRACAAGNPAMTTGVRTANHRRDNTDALRAAFGLRG